MSNLFKLVSRQLRDDQNFLDAQFVVLGLRVEPVIVHVCGIAVDMVRCWMMLELQKLLGLPRASNETCNKLNCKHQVNIFLVMINLVTRSELDYELWNEPGQKASLKTFLCELITLKLRFISIFCKSCKNNFD